MAKRTGKIKSVRKKSRRLLAITRDTKRKVKSSLKRERKKSKIVSTDPRVEMIRGLTAKKGASKIDVPIPFHTLTFQRSSNIDLYTFFQRKKLNAYIQKLLKTKTASGAKLFRGKRIVVSGVRIKARNYDIKVDSFKIQDKKKSYFHYGKRVGNVYTDSDMIAYYIFQKLDDEHIRLYKTETDGMIKRNIKLNRDMKYAKNQTIEITFGHISPKAITGVRAVSDRYRFPKRDQYLSAKAKRISSVKANSQNGKSNRTKGKKTKATRRTR